MKATTLQQFRLPTGELVLTGHESEDNLLKDLVATFFKGEIVCFAVSLLTCFSTLWVLAG